MYDLSTKPNLKPFRHVNPYDVINFYAHTGSDVQKGTFVKLQGGVDPDATPNEFLVDLANVPSRAKSMRAVNPNKVVNAGSGERPFGMTLYDVKERNAFDEQYAFRPRHERSEQQIVISGETVPVVRRGEFEINGFVGAPDAGSGAVMSDTVEGQLTVVDPADVDRDDLVGTFMSQSGTDGYALFSLELV